MSIEALMPKSVNKRQIFRDNIHKLVKILDDNNFFAVTDTEKQRRESFLSDIATKSIDENFYNVIPFHDKANELSWLILADDDLTFVRIFANISIRSLDLSRDKLLNLANELNLNKNTLLDVAIDDDNDLVCEYHMPIGIGEDIVLNVMKGITKEIAFVMQYIAKG
ncbi:MAG: hypothetical protein E6Q32_06510 [Neisseriales bacterium]|nr:MAG: hypothetical protein E6Q32_06510 [Neisseriales bacterium]